MKAIEVPEPGAGLELVDRETPTPASEEVLVDVAACGVCHGDSAVIGGRPPIDYPRIPGHEIGGVIDATGTEVSEWSSGDEVAVGWHGGHCFACDPCRRGDFVNCKRRRITGILDDGGYAEYVTVPEEALISVPDRLDPVSAGPLACAGLTAFTALRSADLGPGDLVAVQGIGGVGHLGIQFASSMGFRTVALSRGTDKREAAFELGADVFVDAEAKDPAGPLSARGGADAILATAPSGEAIESVLGGLGANGELLAVGAPEDPVELDVTRMLDNRWSLRGWSAGTPGDAEDALEAAVHNDVRPWVETHSLEKAPEAFERMKEGSANFRTVLEP